MKELICFRATTLPDNTRPPEWIMYAPAGRQEISARLDGQVRQLTVMVDEETAKALDGDLFSRLEAGGPVPFFDFHHEGRDAAGYPMEFAWRPDGVWCRVQWTAAGAAAVTAAAGQKPTIRYFSPRAAYDEKAGRITGLLPAELGNAAGGLVSDPAFVKISPLTAAKAATGAIPSGETQTPKETTMDYTKVIEALVASGLMTQAECDAPEAGETLKSRLGEMTAAKEKMGADLACSRAAADVHIAEQTKLRAELTKVREDAAQAFVRELSASGKIPPRAQATADMWRANYLRDPEGTRKASAELTASRALGGGAITDGDDGTPDAKKVLDGPKAEARAAELMASKAAPNFDAAWTMAMREQGV